MGLLTDLRFVWIPIRTIRMTRGLVPGANFLRSPAEPREVRLTHVRNLQRSDDRRALSFESEGRLAILFFWSDRGRTAREVWYEYLAQTSSRGAEPRVR